MWQVHSLGLPLPLPIGLKVGDTLRFLNPPESLMNIVLGAYLLLMCVLDLAKELVIHFFMFLAEMLSVCGFLHLSCETYLRESSRAVAAEP